MQARLQFFDGEPIRMERHHVRCPVLFVIPTEVFLKPLEDLLRIVVVQYALVQIRTMSSLVILDVMLVQRNFPNA